MFRSVCRVVEPLDSIPETTEKYNIAQELMLRTLCSVVEPLDPILETTEMYNIAPNV